MKKQSTTKGFAVLSAAGMASKVLSLIYVPFLIIILNGDAGYANYNITYQVYTFIYVLTNAGIPVAISKLISEMTALGYYKEAIKSFKISRGILIVLGLVMSLVMFFMARPLTRLIGHPKVYLAVIALCPAIFFTSIASAYRGYFQGRENMTPTAVSQIIEQVANAVFSLLFAYIFIKYSLDAGVAGGTVGTTVGAVVSFMYLIIVYRKNSTFKVPKGYIATDEYAFTNKQLLRKIVNYSVPITISIGMNYAGSLVDMTNTTYRLLASGIFTKLQADAKYGSLCKYQLLMNIPIALVSALATAVIPTISSSNALNNKKEVRAKVLYALRTCFLFSIPSAVGLAILSKPIFKALFPMYIGGADLMKYGSCVLVFTCVVQIEIAILQGIGKLYSATLYSFIGIVVKIIANYILIANPKINIYGAIIGSILGFSVTTILNLICIKRNLKIKLSFLKTAKKPFCVSVVMGIVVFLIHFAIMKISGVNSAKWMINILDTVVSTGIGVLVYFYGIIITKAVDISLIEKIPYATKLIPSKLLELCRK